MNGCISTDKTHRLARPVLTPAAPLTPGAPSRLANPSRHQTVFEMIEIVCVILFTIDYAVRLLTCPKLCRFFWVRRTEAFSSPHPSRAGPLTTLCPARDRIT